MVTSSSQPRHVDEPFPRANVKRPPPPDLNTSAGRTPPPNHQHGLAPYFHQPNERGPWRWLGGAQPQIEKRFAKARLLQALAQARLVLVLVGCLHVQPTVDRRLLTAGLSQRVSDACMQLIWIGCIG